MFKRRGEMSGADDVEFLNELEGMMYDTDPYVAGLVSLLTPAATPSHGARYDAQVATTDARTTAAHRPLPDWYDEALLDWARYG